MKKANKSKEKETTVEREEGEFWFEVTPEEYLADVVAGVDPETLIRPGRHKAIGYFSAMVKSLPASYIFPE